MERIEIMIKTLVSSETASPPVGGVPELGLVAAAAVSDLIKGSTVFAIVLTNVKIALPAALS